VGKVLALLGFTALLVVAPLLYFVADVSLADLLSLGAGALFLVWLIVLLTVPWNLFFQARRVLMEIKLSRERGLTIPEDRDTEARLIARRLLWAAVGSHLVSAGVVAVISFFSGEEVGYYFAGFYLVSTLLRPSQAYFTHLHHRLTAMLREVKYPREDVVSLKSKVLELEGKVVALENHTSQLTQSHDELRRQIDGLTVSTGIRADRLDGRLDALGRKFGDTVNQLTDNREVISGIRAFLRLLREEQDSSTPTYRDPQ
jgi:hypothetical protein